MTEIIDTLLGQLGQQHNVQVIYACETGSRAWGFPSPDSDYDIRVVYRHGLDWYPSLKEQKDTLEYMSADGVQGVSGWDIGKCLRLMWRSNGALLERVQSPIVYRNVNNAAALLRSEAFNCFSPVATMYHYLGMAKTSFVDVEGREEIRLKKLFYALRAALACKWITDMNTPPPIVFMHMVDQLQFDPQLKMRIQELIELKAGKSEKYMHPAEPEIAALIASEIALAEHAAPGLPGRNAQDIDLDQTFRTIIKW